MARPFKKPSEVCCNRVDLQLNDNDYEWLSKEAQRRRIGKATLAKLLVIHAMKELENTLPDMDSS